SRTAILRFVDEAIALDGADPKRVYLVGFSQGAVMALACALSEPQRFAGIVAMSGWIPDLGAKRAPAEAMPGLPVLVLHGTRDPILPVANGRAVRDLLATLPVAAEYRELE